jgi:hypothetical protein
MMSEEVKRIKSKIEELQIIQTFTDFEIQLLQISTRKDPLRYISVYRLGYDIKYKIESIGKSKGPVDRLTLSNMLDDSFREVKDISRGQGQQQQLNNMTKMVYQ